MKDVAGYFFYTVLPTFISFICFNLLSLIRKAFAPASAAETCAKIMGPIHVFSEVNKMLKILA
jgi:hypothetical protein